MPIQRSKFEQRSPSILAVMACLVACQAAVSQDRTGDSAPLGVQSEVEPTVQFDVVYGETQGRELHLDIAVPFLGDEPMIDQSLGDKQQADSGKVQADSGQNEQQEFPCVLLIHGGAWRQGNKASLREQIVNFAKRGYVAATIEYRFCPEHRFPSQVHDVKQAVRFLRSEAENFSIDRQRFAAIGFSAGAHLSMMLGTTDSDDGLEGAEVWIDSQETSSASSKVQAVVAYFGPTDFTQDNIPAHSEVLLRDFIGGTLADMPDSYRAASPITHVDVNDAAMLLFQGTRDPLVPYQQAFLMADSMTSANIDGRVELLIGASHGWGGERMDRTIQQTFQFLEKHLR